MGAPVDAHGQKRQYMNARSTSGGQIRGTASRTDSDYAGTPYNYDTRYVNWYNLYAKPLQGAGGSGGYGGGGSGGGGRGGGGGYGYGGGADKVGLTNQLNSQRDAARGALPGYLAQYTQGVKDVGAQNQALGSGYSQQIQALFRQLQAQAQQENAGLQNDLALQGAPTQALAGQAGQNMLGINSIATAQDAYNQRLAQVMAQAQAGALTSGQQINQAAQGQLDNAYMQALMQIQGMR